MTDAMAKPVANEIRLLKLMADLTEILEQETVAVREHRHQELHELTVRKQKLLLDYQAELKSTAQNPQWIAGLDAGQQSMLRDLGIKLETAIQNNARIIKIAVSATQRLLQGIIKTVREEALPHRGYQHLVQPDMPPPSQAVLFRTMA